ncbi:hypothetical protein P0D91_15875 [Pseudomonas sp. CBSPBW29]|uniref:hypothetical protein n=1 Tax=Pseudomonas sp. CBS TaxID=2971912 RepID=UPI0021AC0873|nr:hypothetical protein [Pseudomonas sp. CBS]WEL45502.1 hypothetical protein P0D91_15875 [Pseudomonas sp. CBSPBW29]WEL66604.1 hypothetical protein P0D93_10015 [Pseudomonas sp. CBSPGW29]WEL70092.1 hypothetical protein P0D94_29335 [Pseudomonas sp. CBSPCGW29]WEL77049.1 hypothetical protein P0D92_01955 [Pseudomonas sp. CBSPAW29]WEL84345.1 hypothetical protein P0D95_10415 [Pseudomonas sp. CBSPCAW29]WEL87177.1 hypothetical protein P0D90_26140 [Pseudomonas sp. CBSPCBW29]
MPINLDVVIDTEDYEVDMKAGLETLQGVSEATLSIAETLVTGKVSLRHRGVSSVRTILKKTFKGSYGQIFTVEISDEKLQREYKKIGNQTFVELMSYFMKEALYVESVELSEKAQRIVEGLGDSAEDLIKKLRVSSMEDIHKVSTRFNHDVKIRYRKNLDEKVVIASFNKSTVLALQAKESDSNIDITASITRLNINTGNGRLLLKGADETVAFGFGIEYKEVRLEAKKKFSENLDHNNGIDSSNWKNLKIIARPIKLRDGKIVKYIIKGFYND